MLHPVQNRVCTIDLLDGLPLLQHVSIVDTGHTCIVDPADQTMLILQIRQCLAPERPCSFQRSCPIAMLAVGKCKIEI